MLFKRKSKQMYTKVLYTVEYLNYNIIYNISVHSICFDCMVKIVHVS